MNFNKIKLTNISCLFFLSVVLGCGGESDGEGSDSGISSSEVLTKINSYQLTTDLEESIHQLRSLETKCMLHMALFQRIIMMVQRKMSTLMCFEWPSLGHSSLHVAPPAVHLIKPYTQ